MDVKLLLMKLLSPEDALVSSLFTRAMDLELEFMGPLLTI
jgi:hypothetical protein